VIDVNWPASSAPGGLVRLLPAGSALVVMALGMAILFEALGQVGLLR
jgi:hypothetical protein